MTSILPVQLLQGESNRKEDQTMNIEHPNHAIIKYN